LGDRNTLGRPIGSTAACEQGNGKNQQGSWTEPHSLSLPDDPDDQSTRLDRTRYRTGKRAFLNPREGSARRSSSG